MSQETKDFLIVSAILLVGAAFYWAWNKPVSLPPAPAPQPQEVPVVSETIEEQNQPPAPNKNRIICKTDKWLKKTAQCDKEGENVTFYADKYRTKEVGSLPLSYLLEECVNQECVGMEVDLPLHTEGKNIVLVFPHVPSLGNVLELIKKGLADTPPVAGDHIELHIMDIDARFAADFESRVIKADVINYHRNKNKVISLYAEEPEVEEGEDFLGEGGNRFFSFSDFETQLKNYLSEIKTPPVDKEYSIAEILQFVTALPDSALIPYWFVVGLDEGVTFPKARSYAVDAQGYSWFYTYQKRYNSNIQVKNRTCRSAGYQNCRLAETWDEPFSDYYIRQAAPGITDRVRFTLGTNNLHLKLMDMNFEDRSPLQTEKEQILQKLEKLIVPPHSNSGSLDF